MQQQRVQLTRQRRSAAAGSDTLAPAAAAAKSTLRLAPVAMVRSCGRDLERAATEQLRGLAVRKLAICICHGEGKRRC